MKNKWEPSMLEDIVKSLFGGIIVCGVICLFFYFWDYSLTSISAYWKQLFSKGN
jgi:hypothetical protein